MFRSLNLHQFRGRIVFILVCFLGLVLVGRLDGDQAPPPTAATYTVDINFVDDHGNPIAKPTYLVNGVSVPYGDISANANETICWQVHTHKRQAHLIIVQPDAVLSDTSGNPREFIDVDEGHCTDNGKVNLPTAWTYKYYVLAYDSKNHTFYGDDPKIRVGGGNGNDLVELKTDLVELKKSCGPNSKLLQNAIDLVEQLKKQFHE